MSLPTVSVIFLSYKQEAYVVAALRAVLAQDLPDYEVIIGDDASPDRTRALIEAELAAYRGRARIVLLPPAPNVGVIRNFNRCVAASVDSAVSNRRICRHRNQHENVFVIFRSDRWV